MKRRLMQALCVALVLLPAAAGAAEVRKSYDFEVDEWF